MGDRDLLAEMLRAQRELQVDSFGNDPVRLEGEERVAFLRWNVDALQDELHELMQEVGWKPWASSRHVNEKEAVAELVDAWHFFMNILWALGGHSAQGSSTELASMFAAGYAAKRAVNTARQERGYDGVSGKCPSCRRDQMETQKIELFEAAGGTGRRLALVTCPCGHVYNEEAPA